MRRISWPRCKYSYARFGTAGSMNINNLYQENDSLFNQAQTELDLNDEYNIENQQVWDCTLSQNMQLSFFV